MVKAKRSRQGQDQGGAMSPIHPHAAAVDIGATLHVAAVGPGRDAEPVRSFGTFTADLHRMADWLKQCGTRTVAMESTGVYWIPAYEVLEQHGFEVVLVNARDAKHVPGRKTDVSDAQWLQRLHEYGLLRGSFRPQGEIAALRAYLRQRERLLDYGASHIQHMQKALTQMNLQLHHVASDITGVTGLRILRAIVAGERDPAVLAGLRVAKVALGCRRDTKTALAGHLPQLLMRVRQGQQPRQVTTSRQPAKSATVAPMTAPRSLRWLVLADIGPGSISCPPDARGRAGCCDWALEQVPAPE